MCLSRRGVDDAVARRFKSVSDYLFCCIQHTQHNRVQKCVMGFWDHCRGAVVGGTKPVLAHVRLYNHGWGIGKRGWHADMACVYPQLKGGGTTRK
jgi:hypothetical protein